MSVKRQEKERNLETIPLKEFADLYGVSRWFNNLKIGVKLKLGDVVVPTNPFYTPIIDSKDNFTVYNIEMN